MDAASQGRDLISSRGGWGLLWCDLNYLRKKNTWTRLRIVFKACGTKGGYCNGKQKSKKRRRQRTKVQFKVGGQGPGPRIEKVKSCKLRQPKGGLSSNIEGRKTTWKHLKDKKGDSFPGRVSLISSRE